MCIGTIYHIHNMRVECRNKSQDKQYEKTPEEDAEHVGKEATPENEVNLNIAYMWRIKKGITTGCFILIGHAEEGSNTRECSREWGKFRYCSYVTHKKGLQLGALFL